LHGRFEALCGAHRAELFRFAYWLARDRAVADDVVQDTLLRAWRSFAALGSETSAKSWLVAIARREFARRFERRTLECAGDADVAEVADPAPSAIDVQEADEVRAAILKLERAYREPLVLQVLMGHSVREIASILEITPAAVLTRLHRARHRLRAQLVLAAD
jgi:RNA polymerase sigma-70 factor (ECF subfamily)